MKSIIIAAICILAPLTLFSGGFLFSADAPPATPKLKITETFIAKFDSFPYGGIFSPDSRRVACFLSGEGGKYVASVDGVVGKEYVDTGDPGYHSMLFSPDSKRYLYLGRRTGKWRVVVDNVEEKEYDVPPASRMFSPDSKHVAYIASRKDKWFVVYDGVEGKEYGGVFSLTFSPDSSRLVYIAYSDNGVIIVDNGAESKPYGNVIDGTLAFSPDSKRLAFVAEPLRPQRPGDSGKEQRLPFFLVVVDGVESQEYMGINKAAPVFSPDSKHVAYAAPVEKWSKWTIVLDGVEGKKHDAKIDEHSLVFSPDSSRLACAAKQIVILDDIEGEAYDSVAFPVFSPDSKRIAYAACSEGKYLVVTDGTPQGPAKGKAYDGIEDITFSPDSSRLVHLAKHGEKVLAVTDGAESNEYPEIVKTSFGKAPRFIFSPDGKHLAYAASMGGYEASTTWFLVLDGVESKPYRCHPDYVKRTVIGFTPDSKHSIYFVAHDDKSLIVVDGMETPVAAAYIDKIIFDSPAKFHYMVVRGSIEYVIIEIEITE
jgi:Tol biopolymer transport system component